MGAWGTSAFENDDAGDFLLDLTQAGADIVREALTTSNIESYLEAPEGSIAVAAAEIVAASAGRPAADLPDEATDWVAAHAGHLGPTDVSLALAALARVSGEDSELAELWAEAEDPGWEQSIQDLAARLQSTRP
jgi:hypothetical protein